MDFQSFKNKFQKEQVQENRNKVGSEPLISVCVQTYQHVDFIQECLDGILMQKTTFPIEILLGDDESTDGTREICLDYAQKYPEKIRLFLHHRENNIKINGSATGRFNFIYNLFSAKGKYIALCEGDDYWTDSLKLQRQVDFLEKNPNYVLTFHPCNFLFGFGEPNKPNFKPQLIQTLQYEYTIKNLLSHWGIPTASLLFRNEIKVLPTWFSRVASGDIALVMLLFKKGRYKLLKDYMSVYRMTGKGVSSSHTNYRMIHYRAVLYSNLNEYFNYKYEKEIYDALNFIYQQFSLGASVTKNKISLFYKVKNGIKRFLK